MKSQKHKLLKITKKCLITAFSAVNHRLFFLVFTLEIAQKRHTKLMRTSKTRIPTQAHRHTCAWLFSFLFLVNLLFLPLQTLQSAVAEKKVVKTVESINPALLYWKELLLLAQRNDDSTIGEAQRYLMDEEISPEANLLLLNLDDIFENFSLIKRSKIECDWGDDFSQGPHLLLPHLSELRKFGFCLALKGKSDIQQGDGEAFVDDILTLFTMASHIKSSPILVNLFVGHAIDELAVNLLSEYLHRLNEKELKALQLGLVNLPREKTVADCLPTEKQFISGWFKEKVIQIKKENPENENEGLDEIRHLVFLLTEADTQDWQVILDDSKNAIDGIIALIEEAEKYYDEIAEWTQLKPQECLKKLLNFRDNLAKEKNPFVRWFLPDLSRVKINEVNSTIQKEMVNLAITVMLNEGVIDAAMDKTDSSTNIPFGIKSLSIQGEQVGFMITSKFQASNPIKRIFLKKKPGRKLILYGDHNEVGKFFSQKKDKE